MSLARIQRLAEIWLPNETARKARTLAVIQIVQPWNAYIDESGQSRHGKEAVAVAGYVATFDSWIRLEKEWNQVLEHAFRDSSVPADRRFFHMTDFIARQKQFDNDWSNEKRDLFIERLATIAMQSTIMGFGAALLKEDYESALPLDIRDQWRDPYYFLVFNCLSAFMKAAKWNRLELPRPVNVLFDNKPKFTGFATALFYAVKQHKDPDQVLGDAAFGSKIEHSPLQAADLLVYKVARWIIETEHDPTRKVRKSLDLLRRKLNIAIAFPSVQRLKLYADFVRRAQSSKHDSP